MGTLIGIGAIVLVGIIVVVRAIANARREALRASLRAEAPTELPAPVAMVWIPTARRRSSSHDTDDPYGALAPGSLEDRARKH